MEHVILLEKCIWLGMAAVGFAVLFNVPSRALGYIGIMGALGGILRVLMIHNEISVIVGTLFGATLIGFLSIYFAHKSHCPPPVLAIPSVIPMIPGKFAYKMMIGLIELSGDIDPVTYTHIMSETLNNCLKVMFILMSIAGGVGIPLLIARRDTAKGMRLKRRSWS
ncbi:MAG: threonine/serine exporter family protein [Arcticibacter sp.]